jgi:hypothetical protein
MQYSIDSKAAEFKIVFDSAAFKKGEGINGYKKI